jgi:hypothetical protein
MSERKQRTGSFPSLFPWGSLIPSEMAYFVKPPMPSGCSSVSCTSLVWPNLLPALHTAEGHDLAAKMNSGRKTGDQHYGTRCTRRLPGKGRCLCCPSSRSSPTAQNSDGHPCRRTNVLAVEDAVRLSACTAIRRACAASCSVSLNSSDCSTLSSVKGSWPLTS